MKVVSEENGIYMAEGPICTIGQNELDKLKAALYSNPKHHVRINAEPDAPDGVIETIFAFDRNTAIRPHMHPHRSEAYHVIEGEMDAVLFTDGGQIDRVVRLGSVGSGLPFYYRLTAPIFHTIIIRSEILVMHEVVKGPRGPEATVWAEFAPDAGREPDKAKMYFADLIRRTASWTTGTQ